MSKWKVLAGIVGVAVLAWLLWPGEANRSNPGPPDEKVAPESAEPAVTNGALAASASRSDEAPASEREPLPGAFDPRPARAPHVLPVHVVDDRGLPLGVFGVRFGDGDDFSEELRGLGARDGRYDVPVPGPGRYWIYPFQESYLLPRDSEDVLGVVPAEEPLEFVLERAASLQVVVRRDGIGVGDVNLRLVHTDVAEFQREPVTGPDGAFTFENLRAGDLRLTVATPPTEVIRELRLVHGEERTLEVDLLGGGYLDVRVIDGDGLPMEGVQLAVLAVGKQEVVQELADGLGRALLGPYPAGEYEILSSNTADEQLEYLTARATVVDGETREVMLAPKDNAKAGVKGHVFRGGEPVPEARVTFFLEGEPLLSGFGMANTDAQGRYETRLAAPGTYFAYVQVRESGGSPDSMTPEVLELPSAASVERDFHLPDGGIRGTLSVSEEEYLDVDGVFARRTDPHLDQRPRSLRAVDPPQGGKFEIPLLAAGTYRLVADGNMVGVLDGVQVEEGRWTEVVLPVRWSSRFQGRVVGPDGRPFEGAIVFQHDGESGRSLPAAESRSDGRFLLRGGVGPISFSARAPGLATEPMEVIEARSLPESKLAEGNIQEVELRLVPGFRLEVTSVDAEGGPRAASLRLFDAGGREMTHLFESFKPSLDQVLSSHSRGFGPLVPGRYRVVVHDLGGREEERWFTLAEADQALEVRFD